MAVASGQFRRCQFPMEGFATFTALVYLASVASCSLDAVDMAKSMERARMATTLDIACLYVGHDFLCQYFFKKS